MIESSKDADRPRSSSPAPPRTTLNSRRRPPINPNVHALLLPQVHKRLDLVALSAQALQVVVIVAAAVG